MRRSLVLAVAHPVVLLLLIGTLLEGYVDRVGQSPMYLAVPGSPTYSLFVGSALLAVAAAQVGVSEAMWSHPTPSTEAAYPMGRNAKELVEYRLVRVLLRVLISGIVLVAVLAGAGAVSSPVAFVASLAAATLTGLSISAPVAAYRAWGATRPGMAAVQRLFTVPMVLLSGAFFPVFQLSEPLEKVAKAMPLWHGVELCRMSVLGTYRTTALVAHISYLVALFAAGYGLARWRLQLKTEV